MRVMPLNICCSFFADTKEEYDRDKIDQGAQFFRRNYFSMFVSMLMGLLSLMYVETIVRVLHLTGRSHTPALAFTRYLGTLNHAVQWYEGLAAMRASLRTVLQLHRYLGLFSHFFIFSSLPPPQQVTDWQL